MLRTILGEAGFRHGMDLYFQRHDGQAVTIEDFLAAFADATGADLGQFKRWYSQAGTPEIAAKGEYDERRKTYTLTLGQSTPPTPGQNVKLPLHIPVRFGLIGPNGADIDYAAATGARIEDDVIHLTEASQTIVFRNVASSPVPSLFRGFSAPVRLSIDLKPQELLFQLRADADPFNRWQAAQMLANRALLAATAAARKGEPMAVDAGLIDAFGAVPRTGGDRAGHRRRCSSDPSEADIAARSSRDVDPQADRHIAGPHAAAISPGASATWLAALPSARGSARIHAHRMPPPPASAALASTALDLLLPSRGTGGDRCVVRRLPRRRQ